MFESVLLPAPFSPSSACTSPTAASTSTRSFATTPGKRFVIPRSRSATAAPWGTGPAGLSPTRCGLLALWTTDDPLHQPVHRVALLHRQHMALRDAELPALVVERARERLELASDDRRLLRRDRGLRLRRDRGAVGGEADEAGLHVP